MNRETRAFIWHFFMLLLSFAGLCMKVIDFKAGSFTGWDYFISLCWAVSLLGAYLNIQDLINE